MTYNTGKIQFILIVAVLLIGLSGLMDLRGSQGHNQGCRYELRTLAQVARERHVVVLADAITDMRAAQEQLTRGRADRFMWVDTSRIDGRKRRELLGKLFEDTVQASFGGKGA